MKTSVAVFFFLCVCVVVRAVLIDFLVQISGDYYGNHVPIINGTPCVVVIHVCMCGWSVCVSETLCASGVLAACSSVVPG